MSKGSNRRPTDEQAFGDNFDSIFGNRSKEIVSEWKKQAEAAKSLEKVAKLHNIKTTK